MAEKCVGLALGAQVTRVAVLERTRGMRISKLVFSDDNVYEFETAVSVDASGVGAQCSRHSGTTTPLTGFKELLALPYETVRLSPALLQLPAATIVEAADKTCAFEVGDAGSVQRVPVDEALRMFLQDVHVKCDLPDGIRTVLTIPYGYSLAQRAALHAAASSSGFRVVAMVLDAEAIAFRKHMVDEEETDEEEKAGEGQGGTQEGADVEEELAVASRLKSTFVAMNIGAHFTNIAEVSVESKSGTFTISTTSSDGVIGKGRAAIEQRLVDLVLNALPSTNSRPVSGTLLASLRRECEPMVEPLIQMLLESGTPREGMVEIKMPKGYPSLPSGVVVQAVEFGAAIKGILDSIRGLFEGFLVKADRNAQQVFVRDNLLLAVKRSIAKKAGSVPMTTAVEGAAMLAFGLRQRRSGRPSRVRLVQTLTRAVGALTASKQWREIIPKGAALGSTVVQAFHTEKEGQMSLSLAVWEAPVVKSAERTHLGTFELPLHRPRRREEGTRSCRATFHLHSCGTLELEAEPLDFRGNPVDAKHLERSSRVRLLALLLGSLVTSVFLLYIVLAVVLYFGYQPVKALPL